MIVDMLCYFFAGLKGTSCYKRLSTERTADPFTGKPTLLTALCSLMDLACEGNSPSDSLCHGNQSRNFAYYRVDKHC